MRVLIFFTIFINHIHLYCQNWERIADSPGLEKDDATAFVIGDYAYVGTGRAIGYQYCRDFYAYHIKENKWHKIKDFPGDGR